MTKTSAIPSQLFRPATMSLIARIVAPLTDSGLVTVSEYKMLVEALRSLTKREEVSPIQPRLIDGKTAAEMLGISFSQFRTLEKEGKLAFQRKMVGDKTVRFLNTDVLAFMEAATDATDATDANSK